MATFISNGTPITSPSPQYDIPLVSNNGVLKVSKNLANFDDVTYNSSAFSIDKSTGTLTGSGSDANFSFWLRNAKANTTYIISANYTSIGKSSNFQLRDSNNTSITSGGPFSDTGVHEFVFSIPADGDYRINMRCNGTSSSFVANNIQLELGSTATAYHPYGEVYVEGTQETIVDSANHTANVATLLGVGDYHDTQNINTGAITRNVGVKVLDGTENFETATATNCYSLTNTLGTGNFSDRTIMCSHFANTPTMPDTSDRQGLAFIVNKGPEYTIAFGATTQFSTQALWQQFLADQYNAGRPVIVIYPLATPTTESVTGQTLQVQAGDNILEITQASLNGLELEAKYQKSA